MTKEAGDRKGLRKGRKDFVGGRKARMRDVWND